MKKCKGGTKARFNWGAKLRLRNGPRCFEGLVKGGTGSWDRQGDAVPERTVRLLPFEAQEGQVSTASYRQIPIVFIRQAQIYT